MYVWICVCMYICTYVCMYNYITSYHSPVLSYLCRPTLLRSRVVTGPQQDIIVGQLHDVRDRLSTVQKLISDLRSSVYCLQLHLCKPASY